MISTASASYENEGAHLPPIPGLGAASQSRTAAFSVEIRSFHPLINKIYMVLGYNAYNSAIMAINGVVMVHNGYWIRYRWSNPSKTHWSGVQSLPGYWVQVHPCVPALPRWCWGLGAGVATGTGGPAGLAAPGAAAASGAVGPVSVVMAGSGGPGSRVRPRVLVVVWFPPVGPQLVWSFRFR